MNQSNSLKPMKDNVIEKLVAEILNYESIVLWGAARGGRKAVEILKNRLDKQKVYFIDQDPLKVGVDYCGYKVFSADFLLTLNESDTIIAITCADCVGVEQTIRRKCFNGKVIVFDVAWEEELPFSDYYQEHKAEYDEAYELFHDDLSKSVFQSIINYRLSHLTDCLKPIISDVADEYFGEPVDIKQVEYYLDGGAYDGDSTRCFIEKKGDSFFHVYAFEPNMNNLSRLIQNFSNDDRVSIFPYALNDSEEVLRFDNTFFNGGSSGFVSDKGDAIICGVTIDNLLKDKRIDLIKLDIEGSETKALKGAQKTIATQHPKLAVCVYHKRSDLFEIPLMIKQMNPNYKLFLRHYSPTSFESVVYAI